MKNRLVIILLLLLTVCGYTSWANISEFGKAPFDTQKAINDPYSVNRIGNKTYIISESKTEIEILNQDYEIESIIKGGKRNNRSFYYAESVVTGEDNSIYISDVIYTEIGTQIQSERIMKYSNGGRFKETVFQCDYQEEKPMQYGNICALSYNDGKIHFVKKCKSGYTVHELNKGEDTILRDVKLDSDVYLNNISCNWNLNTVCFTDKRGNIYLENDGQIKIIHTPDVTTEDYFEEVPWCAVIDDNQHVYYTDIRKNAIYKISSSDSIRIENSDLFKDGTNFIINYNEGFIGTTDRVNVVLVDSNGNTLLNAQFISYSRNFIMFNIFVWISAIIFIMSFLALLFICMTVLIKKKRSKVFGFSIIIALAIVISGSVITFNILGTTEQRIHDKVSNNMTQTASTISEISSQHIGDLFQKINSLDDYMDNDYKFIKNYMNAYADSAYQNKSNLYYIFFKVIDGYMVAQIDYENKTSMFYPYCLYEGSGYEEAYENKKIVQVNSEKTDYGIYSYSFAPLYNSKNEVVGVVEIGTDLYNEQLKTKELIQSIVISVVVLILIILLILTEATFFVDFLSRFKRSKVNKQKEYVLDYVRTLAFLIFFASGFDNAFIPQLSERIFKLSGISMLSFVGPALPISMQFLFIAIMTIASGFIIDKWGIKKVLLAGLSTYAIGWLCMSYALNEKSYVLLLLAEAVIGGGIGSCIASLNGVITTEKNLEKNNKLFADFNIGLISGTLTGCSIGGALVSVIGYFAGYVFNAIIAMICMLFALNFVYVEKRKREIRDKSNDSILKFLSNPRIFSYLVFIMVPFLIMVYYKDYMFPLYADSQGINEANIGNILLICGVATIYLGSSLSKYTLKFLGAKGSIVLSSVLYIISLVLFGFFPSLETSIFAVFIMCVACSFGNTNQSVYYTSLGTVKGFGEVKALGVSGLFDNGGQTMGPIIFGYALMLGYPKACMIIGGISAVLLVLFILINIKKETKKHE